MSDPADIAASSKPELTSAQRTCSTCGKVIYAKAEICPGCGVRQRRPVSKPGLLFLTLLMGGIGGHKFYLGKYWQGSLYLLFCWTSIPTLVAFVEFIIYAFTSSDRLNERYSAEGSLIVIVVAVAVGFIFVLGILAAIALPAYQDYTKRAKIAEGLGLAGNLKTAIADSFSTKGPSNMSCSIENCRLGSPSLGPTSSVRRIASDITGVIVIEYDEEVFPTPGNKLAIAPQIEGKTADLSNPANAGRNLTWKCGGEGSTSIETRYLPVSCK